MHEWMNQYRPYSFPVYFAVLWVGVTYWAALIGGWRLLAKRFRMQGPFTGEKWHMQSASMRLIPLQRCADGWSGQYRIVYRSFHLVSCVASAAVRAMD